MQHHQASGNQRMNETRRGRQFSLPYMFTDLFRFLHKVIQGSGGFVLIILTSFFHINLVNQPMRRLQSHVIVLAFLKFLKA